MLLNDFLEYAKAYGQLGWTVQEQLDDILGGEDLSRQNPNALREIADFLGTVPFVGADDLVSEIEAHLVPVVGT